MFLLDLVTYFSTVRYSYVRIVVLFGSNPYGLLVYPFHESKLFIVLAVRGKLKTENEM